MAGFAPRYTIIEEASGFRVEGRDRSPVFVRLAPSQAFLLVGENPDELNTWHEGTGRVSPCGLYAYHRLLAALAERTMQHWQRPPHPPNHWSGIGEWALGRTRRALHYRGVYQQWQRLLALVPEPQRRVTKAVFAATFNTHRLGCEIWPEVYHHPYLVEDILRYRAAACAVHYAEDLVSIVGRVISKQREAAAPTWCPGPLSERFEALYAWEHSDPFFYDEEARKRHVWTRAERRQEVVGVLAEDWKACYSGSGKAGTSLRRTLMNLPGGVSGRLLCALPWLGHFLTRPVTDRVELTLLLAWANELAEYNDAYQPIGPEMWEGHLYAKARRVDIRAALHLLSASRQRVLPGEAALTPWKQGLTLLVSYLHDYCHACRQDQLPAHQGTIVGLTEKTVRWHRDVQEREAQLRQAMLDGTARAALPSIPLPDDPAITFLSTVRDILHEGASMHHCIASYASDAVKGRCYLFHVTAQGTEASVQVNAAGRVIQAFGPFNSFNAASSYGWSVLQRWGSAFPPKRDPAARTEPALVPDGL